MKIYFAGSIRGGREDQEFYNALIAYLQTKGTVLTEHIGLASLSSHGESGNEQTIYSRDLNWLLQADVIIAEVSSPSLGVGYEISFAETHKKPIICLYRLQDGKKLSAMIRGNKNLTVADYKDIAQAKKIIDEFLAKIIKF